MNHVRNSLPILLILISLFGTACSKEKTSTTPPKTETQSSASLQITVYKSPTCGCCTEWEDHLRMSGFEVTSHKREDMIAIKKKYGVTREIASCHTAIIDGYVIEGHVPASDIKRLLKERPQVAGLTAPGMPQESPGMQPHDKKPANYDVLSFTKSGKTKVFSSY